MRNENQSTKYCFVSASKKELPKNGAGGSPSKMPTTRVFPLLVRFTLVTVSGLVVCIIPNFSDLMNIIGAVFGTILAFIMPALCHYSLFRRSIRRSDLAMDVVLVVVGCLGCFLGVIEALVGDSDPDLVIEAAAVAAAAPGQLPHAAALKTAANASNAAAAAVVASTTSKHP